MEYRIHIEMSRGMLNLFASISKNKKKVFFIFAVFFKQNVISLFLLGVLWTSATN